MKRKSEENKTDAAAAGAKKGASKTAKAGTDSEPRKRLQKEGSRRPFTPEFQVKMFEFVNGKGRRNMTKDDWNLLASEDGREGDAVKQTWDHTVSRRIREALMQGRP